MSSPTIIAATLQLDSQGLQGMSSIHSMVATGPFLLLASEGTPGLFFSSSSERNPVILESWDTPLSLHHGVYIFFCFATSLAVASTAQPLHALILQLALI